MIKYFAWVAYIENIREISSGVYADLKTFKGAENRVHRRHPNASYVKVTDKNLPRGIDSEELDYFTANETRKFLVDELEKLIGHSGAIA